MTAKVETKQETRSNGQAKREEATEVSRCDAFYLLKNLRRRFVLHYLKRHETAVDLGDMTDQVAAWEAGVEIEDLDSALRKSVYVSLQQSHLPTLDDAGVVRYDRSQGTVELTDRAAAVLPYLETTTGNQAPWSTYYFALTAGGGALTVLLWLGIAPFAGIPSAVWMAIVTCVFAGTALAVRYTDGDTRLDYDEPPPEVD